MVHLEHRVQFWLPQFKEELAELEEVQKRGNKMAWGSQSCSIFLFYIALAIIQVQMQV